MLTVGRAAGVIAVGVLVACAPEPERRTVPEPSEARSTTPANPAIAVLQGPEMTEYYRLRKAGQKREAAVQLDRVIRAAEHHLGRGHPMIAMFHNWKLNLLRELGDHPSALVAAEAELQQWRGRLGTTPHPMLASVLFRVADAALKVGSYRRAIEAAREALAMKRKFLGQRNIAAPRGESGVGPTLVISHGPPALELVPTLIILGKAHSKAGDPAKAIPYFQEIVDTLRQHRPAASRLRVEILSHLGRAQLRGGHLAEAERALALAWSLARQELGLKDTATLAVARRLIAVAEQLGHKAMAAEVRAALGQP